MFLLNVVYCCAYSNVTTVNFECLYIKYCKVFYEEKISGPKMPKFVEILRDKKFQKVFPIFIFL